MAAAVTASEQQQQPAAAAAALRGTCVDLRLFVRSRTRAELLGALDCAAEAVGLRRDAGEGTGGLLSGGRILDQHEQSWLLPLPAEQQQEGGLWLDVDATAAALASVRRSLRPSGGRFD
jgi:hypothetical protein